MSAYCIICEAYVYRSQEDLKLLCDGCKIPAEESSIGESLAEFPLRPELSPRFQLTFQVAEQSTKCGKRMLIDSLGYTYSVKKRRVNTTTWQCRVTTNGNRCRAAVTHWADGTFRVGSRSHSHSPSVLPRPVIRAQKTAMTSPVTRDGLLQTITRQQRVSSQAEELTDAPCPSLPQPEYLARVASRFRQTWRLADCD